MPRKYVGDKVLCIMDKHSGQTATVMDLSSAGMQMRYTTPGQICHQWSRVDLVTHDQSEVLISDLSCKPVYDVAGLAENASFSGDYVRMCGVRFDPVTPRQEMQLKVLYANIAPIEPSEDESKAIKSEN